MMAMGLGGTFIVFVKVPMSGWPWMVNAPSCRRRSRRTQYCFPLYTSIQGRRRVESFT